MYGGSLCEIGYLILGNDCLQEVSDIVTWNYGDVSGESLTVNARCKDFMLLDW